MRVALVPVAPPLLLEAVLSLSDDAREGMLDAFGAPSRPGDGPALARAAFEDHTGPRLARALLFLARFGTARGRDTFVEAARATGDARAEEWLSMRPADVAAQIAIARATGKGAARRAAARTASLALLRVERDLSERPTYELLATGAVPCDASTARVVARALGEVVLDVWSSLGEGGTLRLALFTRMPATTRLVAGKSGRVAARAESASVAIDTILVSPGGQRVAITTARPELLTRYAGALGLSPRPSFTLKPLHALDAAALARVATPPGVHGLAIAATRRRTPDGSRFEVRATDVLAARHAGAGPRAGYVNRATVRVGVGEGTADAFLQLPHRVEVSDPACAADVHAVLAALGLFEPGAAADDARSLAPYEHGGWRWRAVVGDAAFDALVARKLLVRVSVAHVTTEDARMLGASYLVRPVPGAVEQYALAEDRAYGARLVTTDDRAAWRLDLEVLAAAMRADLGASPVDGAGAIAVNGVLDLGVIALKGGKLRFVYAMGAPPRGWLATVRRACGLGVTPVVLVPRGHGVGDAGVVVVELDVHAQLGARGVGHALGRAAEALDAAHEMNPGRLYEEDVVIDAATQRVWVRGVCVPLSDSPYRLLEMLARSGRVMTTKELGAKLSAGGYPDEAARRIKMKLEAQIGERLRRSGDAWDVRQLVVTEGKQGYRLGVSARVIG